MTSEESPTHRHGIDAVAATFLFQWPGSSCLPLSEPTNGVASLPFTLSFTDLYTQQRRNRAIVSAPLDLDRGAST